MITFVSGNEKNVYSTLIKRGGGTGPMKPGNQQATAKVPIPAEFISGR